MLAKLNLNPLLYHILILILLVGCSNEKTDDPIFQLISTKSSGVDFINLIKESPGQNVLTYEYYYNGAGVATGDFNNDGLQDLFFVSNIAKNQLYLNKGDFSFENVTDVSGIQEPRGFATGVSLIDINADGLLDIYVCRSGRFTNPAMRSNLLYINTGNNSSGVPQFVESGKEFGLDITAYSSQATFFDYDRDGDLDMYLANHGIDTYADEEIPNLKDSINHNIGDALYQNNNGKFTNISTQAGIIQNSLGFALGVGIGDFNSDNWPDIYVSNDYSGKDYFYLNQQNGSFLECLNEITGHTSFYSMGNDIGDLNNDGLMDIMVLDMAGDNNYDIKTSMSAMNPEQFGSLVENDQHKQYMYNSLLLNQGISQSKPLFSNVAQFTGTASTDWSWGPLLFDFDNDGLKDIFITNGIKRNIRNNDAIKKVAQLNKSLSSAKSQQEVSRLFQQALNQFPTHQKPNYFFQNKGDLEFNNINSIIGSDTIATTSNGAAYADLDNDGDLDLVINNANQPAMIYQNITNQKENFLQIKAKGSAKNPFGIGLTATIHYGNSSQLAELYVNRGYLSASENIIHFGLSDIKQVDRLELLWPDGKTETIKEIKTNQKLEVDYQNALSNKISKPEPSTIIKDESDQLDKISAHEENDFDDFKVETLLPHKMSQMGPAMAIGDLNGDQLDDLFIGGSIGKSGAIFIQNDNGEFNQFESSELKKDASFEDVSAVFSDLDKDGDLDLIVGSGGNEYPDDLSKYKLRIYQNDGSGNFKKAVSPEIFCSVGVIKTVDIDNDGDDDLFIGGRQIPGKYGFKASSYILKNNSENGGTNFDDITNEVAPFLKEYGMLTDATWADFNGDGMVDLATAGEWMAPKIHLNENGVLKESDNDLGDYKGWWFSLETADIDNDGDQDLIAGNLGLNYKYKASMESPFVLYTNDFDENGTNDIVLSYQENGNQVPVRGRECSSGQMPFIKKKFPTYDAFGKATVQDIFSESELQNSQKNEAATFAHAIFINNGEGQFTHRQLPNYSQLSSANDILVEDFNHDGKLDILLAGNLLESEVETPVSDASLGVLLIGDGQGNFNPIPSSQSGLFITGETKHLKNLRFTESNKKYILVARNEEKLKLLAY